MSSKKNSRPLLPSTGESNTIYSFEGNEESLQDGAMSSDYRASSLGEDGNATEKLVAGEGNAGKSSRHSRRRERVRFYRICRVSTLLILFAVFFLLFLALLLAPRQMSIEEGDSGTDLHDFAVRSNRLNGIVSFNITKTITIRSRLPINYNKLKINLRYTYENYQPMVVLDPDVSKFFDKISPGQALKVTLQRKFTLSVAEIEEEDLLHNVITKMSKECEEKKFVTIFLVISFCPRFFENLCTTFKPEKLELKMPCVFDQESNLLPQPYFGHL